MRGRSRRTLHQSIVAASRQTTSSGGYSSARFTPSVRLKSVDLRIKLESLSFYLKNVEDGVSA